eukprot:1527869-Rhodomonas_salina.8
MLNFLLAVVVEVSDCCRIQSSSASSAFADRALTSSLSSVSARWVFTRSFSRCAFQPEHGKLDPTGSAGLPCGENDDGISDTADEGGCGGGGGGGGKDDDE